MTKKKQKEGESKGEIIDVSYQIALKDWELFKVECEKAGAGYDEVIRGLVTGWTEAARENPGKEPLKVDHLTIKADKITIETVNVTIYVGSKEEH